MASRGETTPLTMTMMGGPDRRPQVAHGGEQPGHEQEPQLVREQCDLPRAQQLPGRGAPRLPGFLQHAGFVAMNPDHHAKSHYDYFKDLIKGDDASAEAHRKFYDEYNAVLDMDADYYLETIRVVFQDFCAGQRHLGRDEAPTGKIERVQPAGHHAPRPCCRSKASWTTSPAPARPEAVHDICSGVPKSLQKHYEAKGAGHYGIFSGRRWREMVYPQVQARSFKSHDKPASAP